MGSRVRVASSSPPAQPEPSIDSSDDCTGVTGARRGEAAGVGPILVCRGLDQGGGEGLQCAHQRVGAHGYDAWARVRRPASSATPPERSQPQSARAPCSAGLRPRRTPCSSLAPPQPTRGRRRAARSVGRTTGPYRLPARPTLSDASGGVLACPMQQSALFQAGSAHGWLPATPVQLIRVWRGVVGRCVAYSCGCLTAADMRLRWQDTSG
jgi:hypothetical protein